MSKKNTGMTKAEAIAAMQKGEKVTHELFARDEFATIQDGVIVTEDGVSHPNFWETRTETMWGAGWSLYAEREVNQDALTQKLIDHMMDGLVRLCDREDHFRKRKAAILARTLEQFGSNEWVTKQLREKGLPKQIFVSPSVNSTLVTQFSHFAPVCCHHALTDQTIMFSWADEYKLPTDSHNLLPGQTKYHLNDAVGI